MGVRNQWARHSARVIRTKRWAALRQQALRRDGFSCVTCGAVGDLEVDHVKPVRTHPELAYDLANLQVLCPAHHSAKTRLECGHPPTKPDVLRWRELVEHLETISKPQRKKKTNA